MRRRSERVRLFAAGDSRSPLARARGQICAANLSDFAPQSRRTPLFMHVSFESHLRCRWERNGGEGEIRTHVPELPDHPISSRRRYDRFGTSPRARCLKETFEIRATPRGARILAER